ncbi:helix-turn-helix transcriptional regulator [Tissierella sp. MSJ-40]|uniref:Helix-turn-helix transcriptional regulator n=1 Tax=Tissierella simiarum TaxID=2841534 RepID=A0ABS6EBF5_9FIRM|nr:helix-turn-helix transcriptional regulator [Tissierella simiarum]MBU5440266.1 helix-turn-helix transcriptional regulator [Tissierella simiarum]
MNRIDVLRKKQKKSYGAIGKEAGLTPTYIYMLAKGKRTNPSLEAMQKISSALGENVEKVFQINPHIENGQAN